MGGARPRARRRRGQALFGIVQGGFDPTLRARERRGAARARFDGYAVGGLSVGEPPEETARVAAETVGLLPAGAAALPDGHGDAADLLTLRGHGI